MKYFFEAIFFTSVFLIWYTYFIYPISLYFMFKLCRGKNPRKVNAINYFPTVSMVIPAYNEESAIGEKLKNCLELDYPNHLIEFVIGSDGSTDRTNNLVERYSQSDARIKLLAFEKREGKASLLNKVIPNLKSEILIFSDADTIYEKDSVKNLVHHFLDMKVGGVCGKLALVKEKEASCREESLYWDYENKIKEWESGIGTIAGINGQIFAIRRRLFEAVPEDSITEDQVLGMKIIEKGYDILFEPKAIARENAHSVMDEFLRRIRISAGNFQSISLSKGVLSPRIGFPSFALWSHKILRWLVPFLLITLFVANLFLLDIIFFRYAFIIQILFYLISFLHYGLSRIGCDMAILRAISYLNLMNLAILIGFFKYLIGSQKVTWQKAK